MDWGPTSDNVGAVLFREGQGAIISFAFHRDDHSDPAGRGQVFVAELPSLDLVAVLQLAAWALMWDWADRSEWSPSSG